jgi:hypothetical protein
MEHIWTPPSIPSSSFSVSSTVYVLRVYNEVMKTELKQGLGEMRI